MLFRSSITNVTEGLLATGSFTVASLSDLVTDVGALPSNITISSGGNTFSFTPAQFAIYPSYPNSYVTWRTQDIQTQYPNIGRSIDIWSESLYADISNAYSTINWQTIITNSAGLNGGSGYSLNGGKFTLSYDYDGPYAFTYSKGGYISFTSA